MIAVAALKSAFERDGGRRLGGLPMLARLNEDGYFALEELGEIGSGGIFADRPPSLTRAAKAFAVWSKAIRAQRPS
jgi:hypothetical protein